MPLRVPPKVLKDPKALENYVHKHVFPKVSQAHRDYLAQFFTEIFSDGFESGNFSAWTGTSGSPSVVSTDKHHGTYCAQIGAVDAERSDRFWKTISAQTTLFVRVYFKLADENQSSYTTSRLFGVRNASDEEIWYMSVYTSGGDNYQWRFYYLNGVSMSNTIFGSVSKATWVCIEVKAVIADGTAGEYRVWIDGSEDKTLTGLDTDGRGNVAELNFGFSYVSNIILRYDCIIAADAYIGPEAEVTLKTVTDSFSLSESVLRNKTLILSDSLELADSLYGNKSFSLSDSTNLSELVTVIIGEVMKYVTDSVSSADLVSTPSRVLRILEAIGATDNVAVNKVLQVTETVSLVEIVEVGVGGVKKTRLFLILGDLVVQLTGD